MYSFQMNTLYVKMTTIQDTHESYKTHEMECIHNDDIKISNFYYVLVTVNTMAQGAMLRKVKPLEF